MWPYETNAMVEPLKNLYNNELIFSLSAEIKGVYNNFDCVGFQRTIFSEGWEKKELKERMRFIARTLSDFLPDEYEDAISILIPASRAFIGFEYMFFPDFVELYGIDDFELSMKALEHFTKYSSSEFAVRAFIKKYPSRTMAQMETWAESENEHLRRLASEGCRPRLPWAMALPEFKKNPAPVLKIIKKLKDDESEYVRRSAANNLNDISKDNPLIVINLAKKWIGKKKKRDRFLKHACRSLLKSGNPRALKIFGLTRAAHVRVEELKADEAVTIGDSLSFSFFLKTNGKKLGRVRLEYAVDFKKSTGKLSRKIFKVCEGDWAVKAKNISKIHSFKVISTRRYYAGVHGLAIIVNGKERAARNFILNKKGDSD